MIFNNRLYRLLKELWLNEFVTPSESYEVLSESELIQKIKATGLTIMISAPYMMYDINTFKQFFSDLGFNLIIARVEERLSGEELKNLGSTYQIAITGDDAFNREVLLDLSTSLKAICKWGTGIDSIDVDTCDELGIQVLNTPNAFTIPVAQTVLTSILGYCRQIYQSTSRMKKDLSWVKIPSKTVEEVKIGIIGFGNIGREVARLLKTFSANVVVYDILEINQDLATDLNVTVVQNLSELIQTSDIICLCCTLNQNSRLIINEERIGEMKRGVYIINCARGDLISQTSLIKALESGHIAGAALDVFQYEPLEHDSPLRHIENPDIILSSHNSNSSPKYWERVHLNTVRNALKVACNLIT